MREGDIVVTNVARHYVLGRVTADRSTQAPIEAQAHRAEALSRACRLAGADHWVFLVDHPGRNDRVRYDCTNALGAPRPVMAKAGIRPTAKRRRPKAT
jgi:hypothetical protein